MASLWKHPASPFWAACFTVYATSGSERWKRSLKTKDRKLARKIADFLEDVGRSTIAEEEISSFSAKIPDAKARAAAVGILADVFRAVTGRGMGAGTLRAFVDSWLDGIRGEIAPQSFLRYNQVGREFVAFIGGAADRDIMSFGARDDGLVLGYRDQLAKRIAPNTVNVAMKIVRQMFKAASQRFKIDSPARMVGGLKVRKADTDRRRGFTLPELGRIVREARGSEWEGIILAGLYTGQRLADIAALRGKMLTWRAASWRLPLASRIGGWSFRCPNRWRNTWPSCRSAMIPLRSCFRRQPASLSAREQSKLLRSRISSAIFSRVLAW